MDIPRAPQPKRPQLLKLGLVLTGVVAITVLLASLKPAVPTVPRVTVLIDSVRRGEFVRTVGAPGSLVPEQIRWISALTPARVERILAQPGDSVQAETVLLELSNPDVQIQALDAQQQLTAAEAQLVNLRTQLESQRLTQEALVVQARTTNKEAQRTALVAETLAVKELASPFELSRARDQAEEASTRLRIEEQRLGLLNGSLAPQLRVQEEQVGRLRAIGAHRQNEVRGLQVRAGERGVLQELPLQLGQWVTPGMVLARVVQPSRLKAVLRIPETQATEVQIGQQATIDTHNGLVRGRVIRIDPASQGGAVGVEVVLDGDLPPGARPELSVDGTIEIDRLSAVLHVGRPTYVRPDNTIQLFKLVDGGDAAVRVAVKVGKVSFNGIEIVAGLEAGDRVIISDMSRWDSFERVRLR
jgi:multidrug efflux pump subunit AcrA (membrane-fusion protein)